MSNVQESYDYVIVGGGVAAASAVKGIRSEDGSGTIAVLGSEPDKPVYRPDLSKDLWLKDDKTLDLNSVATFKVSREVAELSTLSGITYKAKLNGADAKVEGDLKTTTVSVTRPSKNVLLEISKLDGKPWLSMRMAVEPDGKTAKVTWKNLNTNKGGSYEMARQ